MLWGCAVCRALGLCWHCVEGCWEGVERVLRGGEGEITEDGYNEKISKLKQCHINI